ncbi:MAG: response regulator transcription factor [Lachnospiraceae bacterium]|nr:response regulator transcription factor [Lachnospiraceae bacterium]
MRNILIVEDDLHVGNVLEEILVGEGYGVVRAFSGTEAVLVVSQCRPDLVLLDLMLPGLSGEEVLPHIKGIPVIVLSAKADVEDKVDLLLGGAVDYVTKPFHTKELLARIAVHLRTFDAFGGSEVLRFEELELDIYTRMAAINGTELKLTRTEYAILKLLMQNPTRVISKSQMLELISADTPDCTENSLKTHISNLRRKLREAGGREYVESVWGIGFKMKMK